MAVGLQGESNCMYIRLAPQLKLEGPEPKQTARIPGINTVAIPGRIFFCRAVERGDMYDEMMELVELVSSFLKLCFLLANNGYTWGSTNLFPRAPLPSLPIAALA